MDKKHRRIVLALLLAVGLAAAVYMNLPSRARVDREAFRAASEVAAAAADSPSPAAPGETRPAPPAVSSEPSALGRP
jgi:hypothetical protein